MWIRIGNNIIGLIKKNIEQHDSEILINKKLNSETLKNRELNSEFLRKQDIKTLNRWKTRTTTLRIREKTKKR